MKTASYLIYVIAHNTLTIGGCGYAVFVLGHSGWWFLLAAVISGSKFGPEQWSALWDPEIAEKYRLQEADKD